MKSKISETQRSPEKQVQMFLFCLLFQCIWSAGNSKNPPVLTTKLNCVSLLCSRKCLKSWNQSLVEWLSGEFPFPSTLVQKRRVIQLSFDPLSPPMTFLRNSSWCWFLLWISLQDIWWVVLYEHQKVRILGGKIPFISLVWFREAVGVKIPEEGIDCLWK